MWRTFASLFVAVAVAMLGIGIIAPILPLYADTFGASGVTIGFVFAAFSISRSILGPWVGRFSDRVGRKRILLVGLGAFSAISVLYIVAGSIWELAAFRFLQGAASVMVTPIAQAYVGDITPVGREGRTINLLYAAMFFGVALGPLLGGQLSALWSYHAAFGAMGGLSFVALLLVWRTVPSDHGRRPTEEKEEPDLVPLPHILKRPAVKGIVAYFATRGFWRQGFSAFYPLFAVSLIGWSAAEVGTVLSAYFFAGGLLQIPFGYLADRFKRFPQILVGSVGAPLLLTLIPFVRTTWEVVLVMFAMGAFSAFSRASVLAIRTELGRTHGMATLAGLHGSSFALGQMVGPMAFGAISDAFGVGAVFPFGSVLGLVGSGLVVYWLRHWREPIANPGA
jgi:DHA1 family multidrug resistance protein-like MFS transporter